MNIALLAVVLPLLAGPAMPDPPTEFHLASLFTDNMVFQQATRSPIWGTGSAGSTVRVDASWGASSETRVAADGTWMLTLQAPAAGGPYSLTVRHADTTCVLRNVLAGEVWLCSGQSNMEMPLEGWPPTDTIMNAAQEIANSAHAGIRLFTVTRTFAVSPQTRCEGAWVECSPQTTPSFSATAYFFGRKLHETLRVPVGLIHASWGGTPVEAWTSADSLAGVAEYAEPLRRIADSQESMRALDAWRHRYPVISVADMPAETRWRGLDFRDGLCAGADYPDSAWSEMTLPRVWETSELGNFDGAVWFRKRVEISPSWVNRDLVLRLGPVDDMDLTYVNGQKVGGYEVEGMSKVERVYSIPTALVRGTTLSIAVRVIDNQGGGGIFGEAARFQIEADSLGTALSLAGAWKYLPVAEYRAKTFYVFGAAAEEFRTRPHVPLEFSAYSPTSLFNGMIAPLVPFALRGVIWYQGESNTGNPTLYRRLFPLMIANWRSAFRLESMPFYYVQIAPYAYEPPTRSELLREVQLQCLDVKNSGMAVTLDIGNAHNIHPANKQAVGNRLALWALAKTYGKSLQYSGPLYRSMKKEKKRIVLSFDNTGSNLVLRPDDAGNGFQVAGKDRVFRDARVEVRAMKLAVWHPNIPAPEAVRYGFSNTPPATLFNSSGLPAPSFRTDDWEP